MSLLKNPPLKSPARLTTYLAGGMIVKLHSIRSGITHAVGQLCVLILWIL